MATVIGDLRAILGLDSSSFQRGMGRARATLADTGRDMQRIGRSMSLYVTAPLVAAGAAVTAAFANSTRQLSELKQQADIAGMSVEEFKVAALSVEQYGISQEKLADILKDVNDRIGDFRATGGGPMVDFFEKIGPLVGVTIESFEGLSSSEALALYVSSLEKANASQADMTFYMEAMASDATALIPAFKNGGAALAEMEKRAKALGLSIDENLIETAQQTQADFKIVADVMRMQVQQAMVQMAPAITQISKALIPLLDYVARGAIWLGDFVNRMNETNPAMLKWGLIIAGVAAVLGPVLVGLGLLVSSVGPIITAVGAVGAAFAALSTPVLAAVAAVGGAAYLLWENWDLVGPWFTELFTSIGDQFIGLAKVLAGIVTGDMQLAIDGLKQAWNGLQQFFQTLWDGVVAVFEAAWAKIKPIVDFVTEAAAAIKQASADAAVADGNNRAGNSSPTGWASPDEIKRGLAAGTSGIRDQGAADADAYSAGFREGMGIQSPSKRMMEYGEYLSQGLAGGIDNDRPIVVGAMDRISDGIVGALENAALHGGNALDNLRQVAVSALADIGSSLFRSGLSGLFGSVIGSLDPLAGALRGAGLNAIPAFATGGMHSGGWRLVGENGPELEATGSARYFSASKTRDMMGGSSQNVNVTVSVDQNGNLQAFVDQRASKAAQTMGAQINKALPSRVQQVSANPRKR